MLPSILAWTGNSQTGLRCSFHPLQALLPRSQYECRTDPLKLEKKGLLVVHRLFGGASTDLSPLATVLLDKRSTFVWELWESFPFRLSMFFGLKVKVLT